MALDKRIVATSAIVGVAGVGLLALPFLSGGDENDAAAPSPSPTFSTLPVETLTPSASPSASESVSGSPSGSVSPSDSASPSVSGSPSGSVSPSPTASPTSGTETPEEVLRKAVTAYESKVQTSGGVTETLFFGDGTSVTGQYQPNGSMKATYVSDSVAQSVTVNSVTYAQLKGNELASMKTVRKQAGKPAATWTSVVDKWMPDIIAPAEVRMYLPDAVTSLRPGLSVRTVLAQKKQTVVSAKLTPNKITDKTVRAAYSLPKGSKPVRVEFWIDKAGVLSRVVVNGKGDPSQTVVDSYGPVDIAPPSDRDVITGLDLFTAVKRS